MARKLILILSFFFLFSAFFAYGQGCEEPEGDGEEGAKIIGYIQPQYEYHFTGTPSNTFKFKRARIGLTGTIPYDFSYYVLLENSAFISSTGNPYLMDAFITYKRYKWAKISVGSFKQPFGQEVNTSCSGLYTIERSLASDYFVAPQRDMGIMILGGDNESFVKYAIALMNGKGVGIKDNNTQKDFIARLTFKPIEYIRVGGSFRYGFPNPTISGVTKDRLSYAGEIEFNYGNILVQGEYIHDEGDFVTGGGGCGASDPIAFGEKRDGMHFMGMYMTPWNIQPIVKYEIMNTDKVDETANIQYNIMTFGLNYFFNDKTRLQVNYRYRAEKGAEILNDELLVQMQIKF